MVRLVTVLPTSHVHLFLFLSLSLLFAREKKIKKFLNTLHIYMYIIYIHI